MIALVVLSLVLALVVIAASVLNNRSWWRGLACYRLRLPIGLTPEDVAAWLATLTAGSSRQLAIFRAASTYGLELVATTGGIEAFLLLPQQRRAHVLASLRASLPGVRIEEAPEHLSQQSKLTRAVELHLPGRVAPLAVERIEGTVAAFLASLQPLSHGEMVRTQWLFSGTATPQPSPSRTRDGVRTPVTREQRQAEQRKFASPLMEAVGRIGVTAATLRRSQQLLGQVAGTLAVMDAPGARVRPSWLPSWLAAWSLVTRRLPLLRWPLRLNVTEAVGLFGLPVGELHLPGLRFAASRALPPVTDAPRSGVVLGTSTYPGSEDTQIVLGNRDRLHHQYVLGPTGTGKSTLLANMAARDIEQGAGVIVIDVLGDLVPTIASRVPDARRTDVITIDPTAIGPATGWNPLVAADRELAVDHLVHVFHELYRGSWGPRTQDVLRATLTSLTYAKAADGSAFALTEIPALLTDVGFRRFVTAQAALPSGLAPFWRWFDALSEPARAEVIAPVLNKTRGFVLRTPLRHLLGQSAGIDLSDVFTRRKVLLVRLSKGELGAETSWLIGSLLVASIWLTALRRTSIALEKRRPVYLYLDEFADVVRLPMSFADMLSQARGLGVGTVLASQILGALPETVRTAVLGTVRTHVAFQLGYDDARVLSRSLAPLTASDLAGLGRYEIAVRASTAGRVSQPVTARTLPLPPPTSDADALLVAARSRYGAEATTIEAAIAERTRVPGADGQIGRKRHRGSA